MRTYLSFFSCIAQTSHVSFRLDVCARCATMSATTWLVAENDRASILYLLASFSSVHSGRYWTICCKMGYTLLRVVLVFVFIALVLYTRKADQDNAFCFLSGGFAETPRADSRTRTSRRDRPSPQWPRLLRRITPRGMACHVLLTSARRRLRLPECAGRASCRARRRSIARQIGKREIRTHDWKCNRSRLKVKWRRVRLGEAGRNRIRYGMVVIIFHTRNPIKCFQVCYLCIEESFHFRLQDQERNVPSSCQAGRQLRH